MQLTLVEVLQNIPLYLQQIPTFLVGICTLGPICLLLVAIYALRKQR